MFSGNFWTGWAAAVNIAAMELYPLKFEPIFKQRIWGGQKLREYFNKDIPPFEKTGESWELADLPDDKSVITNGELAGQTLAEAIEQYPGEIAGNADFKEPFPLLIKLLDAEEVLSVQVHPDAEACQRMAKGDPKTECWYIIAAQPGAAIYKGLKKGVTKEDFERAIAGGTVADLLNKVVVKPGECHFLPAGTPHAIGAGLLIAEIQTPSDTTYRVFDFNRVDKNGKSRPLHIAEAIESIHFEQDSSDIPVTQSGRLVDSDYFKVDKGHRRDGGSEFMKPGKLKVLMILSGNGKFRRDTEAEVEFKAGDTILVPACYQGAVEFDTESEYLKVLL